MNTSFNIAHFLIGQKANKLETRISPLVGFKKWTGSVVKIPAGFRLNSQTKPLEEVFNNLLPTL